MENHKIKAEGTHEELFKNCSEYRELYQIENTKKDE
jgi:ABC-type multidrug transport system fused ATPase/permease subunit